MRQGKVWWQFGALGVSMSVMLSLCGCARNGDSDVGSARDSFVSLFEQADTLEIYAVQLPDDEERDHLLVSISRADDVDRWERFIDEAGQAGPESRHEGIPWLEMRLSSGDHMVAAASAYPAFPHASELAFRLPGAMQGVAVTVEGGLNNIVQECQQQADAIVLANSPMSTDQMSGGVEPLPSFEETKARMMKLFAECDYINVHAPGENSMGVNVREEGRDAWEMMAAAVEEAERGWAIPGQPEIYIVCEPAGAPGRPVELHYVGGILGCPAGDLGGNVCTLRLPAHFKRGLDSLLAICRETQREDQEARAR